MDQVVIKKLVLDNVDIFFNLRLESLKNSPESFLLSYEEEKTNGPDFYVNILKQNSDDNVIFGAFINTDLVGIVGLYREMNSRLKHKANLWGTYVLPEMRKLGVANKLINAAINHTRIQMHCCVINLTVGSKNIAAIKLYESCGFKTWGIEPKAILINGKYVDEFHMNHLL